MAAFAEKEGFEPPVPLRVHLISSQAHSTTLAFLLWGNKNTQWGLVLAAFFQKKQKQKVFWPKKVPSWFVLCYFRSQKTMTPIEPTPKRKLVLWLSILLAVIVLALSFPTQTQWFITRYLVNSELGYENYLQNYPQSPYLEKASWLHAKLKNDPALYLDFAADFPKSPQRERALWTAAKMLRESAVYAEYLKHYPEGKLAKQEGANVNRLRIFATVYHNEQKRLATLKYGKVVDKQGHAYRSIQLGKHIWLADNLNTYIPTLSSCFMRHEAYCSRFGKLYTWLGAQEACQKLGPGWRLPTATEWEELCQLYDPEANLLQGSSKVFHALLNQGKSGFDVRGGGYFTPDGGFMRVYYDAAFWTSTPTGVLEAYEIAFIGGEKRAFKAAADQGYALSCRCVQ